MKKINTTILGLILLLTGCSANTENDLDYKKICIQFVEIAADRWEGRRLSYYLGTFYSKKKATCLSLYGWEKGREKVDKIFDELTGELSRLVENSANFDELTREYELLR